MHVGPMPCHSETLKLLNRWGTDIESQPQSVIKLCLGPRMWLQPKLATYNHNLKWPLMNMITITMDRTTSTLTEHGATLMILGGKQKNKHFLAFPSSLRIKLYKTKGLCCNHALDDMWRRTEK